jgi:enoyl-CoA hydratase/carnithine racemase
MEEDDILFGCHRGVATVTLNRPRALNAFCLDMYRRFDSMLRSGSRPAFRDDLARHSDLMSLGIPR